MTAASLARLVDRARRVDDALGVARALVLSSSWRTSSPCRPVSTPSMDARHYAASGAVREIEAGSDLLISATTSAPPRPSLRIRASSYSWMVRMVEVSSSLFFVSVYLLL